jgi:UDP-2,3-diacylglucosamine pyrophosphatase LpxH
MRALVISDTHLGAWTGYDLLSEPEYIERLAPELSDIDEVVMLGDLFDLLFGTVDDAFRASEGLLSLVRERLQGKRFVFLAGNHDHHIELRRREDLAELRLATGESPERLDEEVDRRSFFRTFLERHLEGVDVEIRYPAYRFGDVLLTHGHFLDPHARRAGALGDRILTRALWRIAAGGREDPKTLEDYEGVITLLTELLFTIAQLPHGTAAQRNVYGLGQRVGRVASALGLPLELARRRLRSRAAGSVEAGAVAGGPVPQTSYHSARKAERERGRRGPMPADPEWAGYPVARVLRPSDPQEHSLEAFAKVVDNLGWGEDAEKIVFAHTHQPLADVHTPGDDRIRYWNTGSWIYEPDLSSHDAYASYLERAWPGTAILLDTEAPAPRMVEMLADLNPLNGGPGISAPQAP